MLNYTDLPADKKAFIFEFDGVLYPEKEFYLQVYYLFANFIEYVETLLSAADLLALMQKVYETHGPEEVFSRVRDAFGLDEKYRENFERLHVSAQFPLKLELHASMLQLLQDMVVDRKSILIWANGNPEQQLNKIRQTEWQGLAQYLRLYFAAEYAGQPDALSLVLKEQNLKPEEVLFIGLSAKSELMASQSGIDYLSVN